MKWNFLLVTVVMGEGRGTIRRKTPSFVGRNEKDKMKLFFPLRSSFLIDKVEYTGIEQVTSAMRMQRSGHLS